MNKYLSLNINNIKNIKSANIQLPIEKGLYAIVGDNGSGKSTIMYILSQLVRRSSLSQLNKNDFDQTSFIEFNNNGVIDKWKYNYTYHKWNSSLFPDKLPFDGFYEGSIFYGTRFRDATIVEKLLEDRDFLSNICDADEYVKKNLSKILHNNYDHYPNLKRIKNREIAKKHNFEGMPYFYEIKGNLISQFRMSSGECMLITLLHFVYNKIIRKNYTEGNNIIFLIDEVELALHPSSINRLVDFLDDLCKEYKIAVYFSTHSAEIIRRIKPRKTFQIVDNNGNIIINTPCYPSYAIRDLYSPDGFDYLILVEDDLAKQIVEKVIRENKLRDSRLIHVLPSGDWYNTLKLHKDIKENTVLGIGKHVISVIDGDVVDKVNEKKEFENLVKLFLPIKSIEKYLYKAIIIEKDIDFIKYMGDKYFHVRSIKDIVNDYKTNYKYQEDTNGKNFFEMLTSNLYRTGMNEEEFIKLFCDDLYNMVDFSKFKTQLEKKVTQK